MSSRVRRSARQKIVGLSALAGCIRRARARRQRVVFTNGCFDLIHAGHVRLLEQASALGDVLVVGINSDASVRGLKGPGRPVNRQQDRALVLAALERVDYVTIFNDPTPLAVIKRIVPDVLVKGSDWAKGAIVGADVVEAAGGRVVRVRLVEGASTTGLISKIRGRPPKH